MKTTYEQNDRAQTLNIDQLNVECHIARAKQIRSEVVASMFANVFAWIKNPITNSKPVALKNPLDQDFTHLGKPCY